MAIITSFDITVSIIFWHKVVNVINSDSFSAFHFPPTIQYLSFLTRTYTNLQTFDIASLNLEDSQ